MTQSNQPRESAKARLTYRNGSGYSSIYLDAFELVDNGSIRVTDIDECQHIFAPGADWHLKLLNGETL